MVRSTRTVPGCWSDVLAPDSTVSKSLPSLADGDAVGPLASVVTAGDGVEEAATGPVSAGDALAAVLVGVDPEPQAATIMTKHATPARRRLDTDSNPPRNI